MHFVNFIPITLSISQWPCH